MVNACFHSARRLWVVFSRISIRLFTTFDTSSKKLFSTAKMFKPVTHVLFDMDGVILDTESTYEDVISDIARNYGKEYTREIRLKVRGTPEPETVRIAIKEMQLPLTSEEFMKMYKPMTMERLQHPPLMPGVKKLILHLKKHNVPIAIATSGAEDISITKTQHYPDVFSCFHHTVYGSSDDEVKNGKPHPDIYLICALRFPDKPTPENCLVIEDAPNGVLAGIRAGMQVVMLPGEDVDDELKKPATLVVKSLEDFKPELFGLPAYEN